MMKKFTHEVVNLRISLHILSKKVIKVYTEQTCVNLCKLRPRFTHICPPMGMVPIAPWLGVSLDVGGW